jgi:hypothetical protein
MSRIMQVGQALPLSSCRSARQASYSERGGVEVRAWLLGFDGDGDMGRLLGRIIAKGLMKSAVG